MKFQGKVVLAFALVACLASYTQAVFGDGSLNVRNHEKNRSLSKRSVLELFSIFPWIRNQFARSSTDDNSTTEAPESSSVQTHSASGIKTDIARMLTLTRQRRAPPLGHKDQRARRSIKELRSVESFLKSKHEKLTDALRTFPEGLFGPHHPVQGGPPPGGHNNILLPFGIQSQSTVLFLHHNTQTGKNNNANNPKSENIATTASPDTPASPNSVGPPIVGSAGPPPVIVVVQRSGANGASGLPPSSTTPNPSQGGQTTETSPSSEGTSSEPTVTSTGVPNSSPATTEESNASTSPPTQTSTAAEQSRSLGDIPSASQSPEAGTGEPVSELPSTTEGGNEIEGSGTSEGVTEHARQDIAFRFIRDDV